MRSLLTGFIGVLAIVLVIVGLVNFDLMVELWAKAFVGVLFLAVLVTVGRSLLPHK